MPHRHAILTLALVLVAPALGAQEKVFVAATSATIVSTTDQRRSDPPEHLIYVENRSSVPVTVWNVALSRCENIKQHCDPKPTNIKVRPRGRSLVMRVNPRNAEQGFNYYFGFSWRPDSSNAAVIAQALAGAPVPAGGEASRLRHRELSRDDFSRLGARIATLRAEPESLVLAPGEQVSVRDVLVLVADDSNRVLGRTGWIRWAAPGSGPVRFVPPDQLMARAPGRATLRFDLAEEARASLTREVAQLEVPVVVAFRVDPRAPVFAGVALDADSRKPLACARVALVDSADIATAADRTGRDGSFRLRAPQAGTYRVRFSVSGWAPFLSAPVTAALDEEKQGEHAVRFDEELLSAAWEPDVEHAHPASVRVVQPSRTGTKQRTAPPVIHGVTVGGAPGRSTLAIASSAPSAIAWVQLLVDSAGTADTTSFVIPADLAAGTRSVVDQVLRRVRFSPARERGRPTCELLRMRVIVTTR